ncbi:MAG: hypothetical protein ACE5Q8_07520 [Nitrosopumilus sp.]|jgi:ribosomal protein L37AE/L43A
MKYTCKKCDFKWEGTSYTFDKVREHEKTHSDNIKSKTVKKNKIVSIKCKVCNTSRNIKNIQADNSDNWECQTCGNLLDSNGHVTSS